jgi:hypothetical protein
MERSGPVVKSGFVPGARIRCIDRSGRVPPQDIFGKILQIGQMEGTSCTHARHVHNFSSSPTQKPAHDFSSPPPSRASTHTHNFSSTSTFHLRTLWHVFIEGTRVRCATARLPHRMGHEWRAELGSLRGCARPFGLPAANLAPDSVCCCLGDRQPKYALFFALFFLSNLIFKVLSAVNRDSC